MEAHSAAPLPPLASPPIAPAPMAMSPRQQPPPPPSPATSPLPAGGVDGGSAFGVSSGIGGFGIRPRRLAEQLQAGLMPLLDPRGQPTAAGLGAPTAPNFERPYADDECVHVFRVRSARTGRTRSLVARLRSTINLQEKLFLAVRCNDASRVRLLVNLGADIHRTDSLTGKTPLQLAEDIGSSEVAAVLTELNAGPPAPPPPAPCLDVVPAYPRWDQPLTMGRGGGMGSSSFWSTPEYGWQRPQYAQTGLGESRSAQKARELLRFLRRCRKAREMGTIMDQMQSLNLQSGDAATRTGARSAAVPTRPTGLDVHREFGRLSLTSGDGESDSNLPSQSTGGASSH